MDSVATWILGIEGLIAVASLALLIYLIVRRVRIKKSETFEDRDN